MRSIFYLLFVFLIACSPPAQQSTSEVTESVLGVFNEKDIIWGCPRIDCIPSIDSPDFISAEEAESSGQVNEETAVLGIIWKGEARAYPLNVLNWHEIVNDEIQGDAIAVSYCPLCATGLAFQRTIDGKAVEFGVSGRLWNNNLLMYDRETGTLWSQILAKAVVGERKGDELVQVPLETVYWLDWKKAHPETIVLSQKTGHSRDYDSYPYGDYTTSKAIYFPSSSSDDRMHPKEFVYGVEFDDSAKAYREIDILNELLVQDTVGAQKLIFVVQESKGIRIFDPETHTFTLEDGVLVDESGNKWTLSGSFEEEQLKSLNVQSGFWFSWAATRPNTKIYAS